MASNVVWRHLALTASWAIKPEDTEADQIWVDKGLQIATKLTWIQILGNLWSLHPKTILRSSSLLKEENNGNK